TRGTYDRLQRIQITPPEYASQAEADALDALDKGFPASPPGEPIPMSAWVAISGAAFSTGLGAQTSIGMAMLAGLANIRLGYWWNRSRTPPWEMINARLAGRVAAPDPGAPDAGVPALGPGTLWRWFVEHKPWVIQAYLFNEFTGRFHGAERQRWYLTDGGHFENTAVYELIRRQLPFIIASDNGEDGKRIFDDLANLVRKARIDFGAEISFEDGPALDALFKDDPVLRAVFRAVPQLASDEVADDTAVAMLARIQYREGGSGSLVVIKPRLAGATPLDLQSYRHKNEAFPQQPTIDQFFDEAQWESYYRLGKLLGSRVFAPSTNGWHPGLLRRHF
ncbi:MAG: hypothetical protein ACRCUI_09360, partial [Polymorphobacter sp.]